MTVSSTTSRADYTGNGVTTTFAVPFYFLDNTHLKVISTVIATGVATTLTLGTDYTVTGAGAPAGGSITCTTAPAGTVKLSILRDIPYTQLTHYVENDPFPAASHEEALDKLTMEIQQQATQIAGVVKFPETDSPSLVATLPASVARANKMVKFDASGNIGVTTENYDADLATVAGIASDVTTVANVAGSVTTVAGISTNVTTVAGIASNVTTVGTNINEVEVVAADLGGVRFTNDLGLITDPVTGPGATAPGAITTVAIDIADVKTVAGISANVTTVAGISTNVTAVAGNATNINAVAGNATNINAVAGNATNINAVNANKTNIDAVAGNATNINTVATNIASVNNTSANMAAVIDAPNQAAAAAASAAAAAASAASGMYSAVQDKSANYTVVVGDAGDLIRMTTSGGARTVTLPAISTLPDGFNVTVVKWTGDINSVTVQRSGTDLINGSTSYVLDAQYKSATFVADKETSTWFASGAGGAGTNIIVDAFNGTGSQTAFTLSGDPGSENNTQVYVAGVYQEKDTYSLSGSTLTLSAAPPAGTSNIEVVWSQPLAIGVPSDSSVSTVKLADNAVTTVKVADAAITSAKLAATLDLGVL